MSKMTKIESARIIVEQKGDCSGGGYHVYCDDCFTETEKCGYVERIDLKTITSKQWCAKRLRLAEAYIKRHEQKTKKSNVKGRPIFYDFYPDINLYQEVTGGH